MNARISLDEKLITDITSSISEVVDKTNVFVTMVKQFRARVRKIEIKVSGVPEIKEDDDFEDTLLLSRNRHKLSTTQSKISLNHNKFLNH